MLNRLTCAHSPRFLRQLAGLDPEDERRHIVVDITPAQLDVLLQESGHFESIIDLEVRSYAVEIHLHLSFPHSNPPSPCQFPERK